MTVDLALSESIYFFFSDCLFTALTDGCLEPSNEETDTN